MPEPLDYATPTTKRARGWLGIILLIVALIVLIAGAIFCYLIIDGLQGLNGV